MEKWQKLKELKIRNQRQQLETKQANELHALTKRIITGQDEQRKARSVELERYIYWKLFIIAWNRLLQKYQNIKKELEGRHQVDILRLDKAQKGSQKSLILKSNFNFNRSKWKLI